MKSLGRKFRQLATISERIDYACSDICVLLRDYRTTGSIVNPAYEASEPCGMVVEPAIVSISYNPRLIFKF